MFVEINTTKDISDHLQAHGVTPTAQRVEVARVLLSRCTHMAAEEIFRLINTNEAQVSKATIYNTLGLFVEKGLIREVIVDPAKIFYDSNVAPHHHVYNITTGELSDIDTSHLQVVGLPPLPADTTIDGMDVIVRVRSTQNA